MITLKGIHHFALSVDDLDSSIQWYAEWLGFELERRFGFPDQNVEIAQLLYRERAMRLELLCKAGSLQSPDKGKDAFQAISTQGAKHIGFLVGNIEYVYQEMVERGATILHELVEVEPAGVRNFWMLDNSGNHIEFVQPLYSANPNVQ